MAGWIGRAAAAFGRATAPAPQPFQLPCDCGEPITGWRTVSHQRVGCPSCRQVHLILPGNVYPVVKRSTPPPPAKPAATVVQPDVQPASAAQKSAGRAAEKTRKSKTGAKESSSPAASTATATEPVVERIDLSPTLQQGRLRRRRLRLIVVSIVALFAVTGWSMWSRTRREQARATIPVASKAGIEALRAGDFSAAKRELTLAVQGLDTLGWYDAAAMTIRQAHREAVAGQGLLSNDFIAIAEEFLDGAGEPEERLRRFRTAAGSRWLLFDADLTRSPSRMYEFDVPLALKNKDNQPLQIACDFPELHRLVAETPPGQAVRVIFAAQIDDWQLPTLPTKPMIARLRSASAFLWTDYEAYAAASYQTDPPEAEETETRAILSAQRQLVTP